jgi:FAD dependent monooxygenase
MSPKPDFKVIIVGGSVSGLTLAHCLYHAGIDFIVLEKGSEIAFGGGASIGLQPHGLRILDQMGMYPSILATTKPIHEAVHRRSDGTVKARSHFARQIEERSVFHLFALSN